MPSIIIRKIIKSTIFVCTLYITQNSAHAQFFNGPVSLGAGGTGRASVDPLEGAFLNPASVSHLSAYYFGVYYSDSNDLSVPRNRDFSLMISDSTPDKIIPAAFAYTARRVTGGANTIQHKDFYLALADHVFGRWSFGLGLHHLRSEILGVSEHSQNNFHIGTLFTPSKNMGLALVFYDLLIPGSDIPSEIQLNRRAALGVTYIFNDFVRFRGDVAMDLRNNPDDKAIYMTGIESVLDQYFTLRLGFQNDDQAGQSFVSTGFSFTGPRLMLDYAFQKETVPSEGGYRHLFDLRIIL